MSWSFAIINGRLSEIFFDKRKNKTVFYGHVYVKEEDYKSKKEKEWIKQDTAKNQFSYRIGQYKDKMGNIFKCADLESESHEVPSAEEKEHF